VEFGTTSTTAVGSIRFSHLPDHAGSIKMLVVGYC